MNNVNVWLVVVDITSVIYSIALYNICGSVYYIIHISIWLFQVLKEEYFPKMCDSSPIAELEDIIF